MLSACEDSLPSVVGMHVRGIQSTGWRVRTPEFKSQPCNVNPGKSLKLWDSESLIHGDTNS